MADRSNDPAITPAEIRPDSPGWQSHCDAVEGELRAKRLTHRHLKAIEDWEYEQELRKGRSR